MSANPTHATPWPRGLSREQAAAYVGIGTTFFDQLVAKDKFPKPVKIGARRLWDIRELDIAFDSLKDSEQDGGPNEWDS